MNQFLKVMRSLRLDRRGVTALEYGLIAAAVVAVGLAGFGAIGDKLASAYANVTVIVDEAAD